jgi:AcrR family transcriptional regulator
MGAVADERKRLGRPADTDSADTRARIVECAMELFGNEGFDATTNRGIAKAAGVSSAALYHYFESKADIYVAVCDAIVCRFAEIFGKVSVREPTLMGRLSLLMRENVSLGKVSPGLMGFVAGIPTVVKRHPEVLRGTQSLTVEFRKMAIEVVESAHEKDVALRGLPAAGFADLLVVVLSGLGRLSARGMHDRHRAAAAAFLQLVGPGNEA